MAKAAEPSVSPIEVIGDEAQKRKLTLKPRSFLLGYLMGRGIEANPNRLTDEAWLRKQVADHASRGKTG